MKSSWADCQEKAITQTKQPLFQLGTKRTKHLPTNNRGIKSALRICGFCICGFDRLSTENMKKKKKNPGSFQKKNLILSHTGNYWCRLYIILVIISNLEMI